MQTRTALSVYWASMRLDFGGFAYDMLDHSALRIEAEPDLRAVVLERPSQVRLLLANLYLHYTFLLTLQELSEISFSCLCELMFRG
jgi:hypothetical protein